MPSNYPTSLDTTATLPAAGAVGANLSTFPHSTLHGNANDAIIAIETELGLAPSSTFSTVKSRLDSIAAAIASITAVSTWTPVVTQGVAVTSTAFQAAYVVIGDMVIGNFVLTINSAGTGGTAVTISTPVAAALGVANAAGSGMLFDSAPTPTNNSSTLLLSTATTFAIAGTNAFMGAGAPFNAAINVNDTITGSFHYFAA